MKPENRNLRMAYDEQMTSSFSGVAEFYTNTFEDYFMVNSQQVDIFTLQSLDGTIIERYKVGKGETRIAKILSSGLYIGRLQNQNQTFKIVKR